MDSSVKIMTLLEMYLLMLPTVNLQMPMPCLMGPQVYIPSPQQHGRVPYSVAVPIPVPYKVAEATTTPLTTTKKTIVNQRVYVGVPAPYPMPFAIPAPAPYPVPVPAPAPYPVLFPVPAPYPVPVCLVQPPVPVFLPPRFCITEARPAGCPPCPCEPLPPLIYHMSFGFKTKWLAGIYVFMLPAAMPMHMPMHIPMPMPMPMPVPYPMGPQVYALPPPPPVQVPVPYPVPVPIPYKVIEKTTTTTSTTTDKSENNENVYIAVPAPYPVPVPVYPLPPRLPPPLPIQPPGCFHHAPPVPPMPPPPMYPSPIYPSPLMPPFSFLPYQIMRPPVVVVPFPPPELSIRRWRPSKSSREKSKERDCSKSDRSSSDSDSEESTDESSSSDSSRSSDSKSRKRKKMGYSYKNPKSRRHQMVRDFRKNANARIKRMNEGDSSLSEDRVPQQVNNEAGEDSENKQRVKIVSNVHINKLEPNDFRQPQKNLKAAQQPLEPGKKEIVFKTPTGKKISNLTVSFQVN